jgi:protein deglycase
MKRVIVPIAEGFEEIEAVTIIDILRRAGLDVVVAGVGGTTRTGSHAITLKCDARIEDCHASDADAVVLPGGMPGTVGLRESATLRDAVISLAARGRLVAAVCAAPTALDAWGVLDGKRATSHPAHAREMTRCRYEEAPVVEDAHVVTSRGAGTSIEFAAVIVQRLVGAEAARDVLDRIVYRRP